MCKKLIILSLIGIFLIKSSCAKRIPISYDHLEKDILVEVRTKSGVSYNGIVKAKQPSFIVLQTDRNEKSLNKITKDNIFFIHSKPPIYDYQNKVISEWEIKEHQGFKNTLLYTIGGTGLSFGASFFVGSLVHRKFSDSEYRNTALWVTTGIGTGIGSLLFMRTGKNRDREASIMNIRERRYIIAQKEIAIQKQKREQVKEKLEKMKVDREKQEAEMKRLKERLKQREKIEEEGNYN